MNINENKLKRQLAVIDKWINNKAIGILEAVTGFGKTYVAILIIKKMNEKNPDRTTVVIVPTKKLKDDWYNHIKEHNLLNVYVYIVNSYVKNEGILKCHLLVCDEIHHYSSIDAEVFNKVITKTKYSFFLGLTATLNIKEKQFLSKLNIPIIDNIEIEEAERENYVCKTLIYNLGIKLSKEEEDYIKDLTNSFNNAFAVFEYEFELAQACRIGNDKSCKVRLSTGRDLGFKSGLEWKKWWANESKSSIEYISNSAQRFGYTMAERKEFLYNVESKLNVVKEIVNTFKDSHIITFSESTKFTDKLVKELGEISRAYHSNLETEIREVAKYNKKNSLFPEYKQVKYGAEKLKKEAIELFENKSIRVLCTAKALDEGFNVENIDMGIMCSYTSSIRQNTQRSGRTSRINVLNKDKTAIIVNLYIINSQEEKWLKKKQEGVNNIKWITDINNISIEQKMEEQV